jgi:hypothetical protein
VKNDSVRDALRLAISAMRGALGLVLVKLARRVLPDGAVASAADEVPTAPIRPPID